MDGNYTLFSLAALSLLIHAYTIAYAIRFDKILPINYRLCYIALIVALLSEVPARFQDILFVWYSLAYPAVSCIMSIVKSVAVIITIRYIGKKLAISISNVNCSVHGDIESGVHDEKSVAIALANFLSYRR